MDDWADNSGQLWYSSSPLAYNSDELADKSDQLSYPSCPLADNSDELADNSNQFKCSSFPKRGTRSSGNSKRETRGGELDIYPSPIRIAIDFKFSTIRLRE